MSSADHAHAHPAAGCCGHNHATAPADAPAHRHDHERGPGDHSHANEPHGHAHAHAHAHAHDACSPCGHGHHDHAPAQAATLSATAGGLLLRVPAMDCPTEEAQIRRVLEPLDGVAGLRFDLAGRALAVNAPAERWDAVQAALQQLGFASERLSAPPAAADTARAQRRELMRLGAALADRKSVV